MRHLRQWTLAAACAATAGSIGGWAAADEEAPTQPPPDARKLLVERRTEEAVAPRQTVRLDRLADAADVRKEVIEVRTESLLAAPVAASAEASEPARTSPDNPKVAPGLVRWHADLAAAQAASRVSGKPLLVFQMLGNLDDEFC